MYAVGSLEIFFRVLRLEVCRVSGFSLFALVEPLTKSLVNLFLFFSWKQKKKNLG